MNGIGFFGFLTLLFVALKLTGVITWSWWIIVGTFFVPLLIVSLVVLCVGIFAYFKVD